jgi:hypothetical protein
MSSPIDINVSTFSFPQIAELLEHSLLHLDHADIVVVTGVCKYWRNCVDGSEALKRKMHKSPVSCTADANPHFEELTEESKDVVVRRFKFAGENLWRIVREMEDEWISSINDGKEGTDDETDDPWENSYWGKRHDLRCGFKDVRYPDG